MTYVRPNIYTNKYINILIFTPVSVSLATLARQLAKAILEPNLRGSNQHSEISGAFLIFMKLIIFFSKCHQEGSNNFMGKHNFQEEAK